MRETDGDSYKPEKLLDLSCSVFLQIEQTPTRNEKKIILDKSTKY